MMILETTARSPKERLSSGTLPVYPPWRTYAQTINTVAAIYDQVHTERSLRLQIESFIIFVENLTLP
jgi:hypothetical protein